MAKHVIHAGHAPCRGCGADAARAPIQRLRAPRGFAPPQAEQDGARAMGGVAGHDLARMAVHAERPARPAAYARAAQPDAFARGVAAMGGPEETEDGGAKG